MEVKLKTEDGLTFRAWGRQDVDPQDVNGPLLGFDVDEWELAGPDGERWGAEHCDFEAIVDYCDIVDAAESNFDDRLEKWRC